MATLTNPNDAVTVAPGVITTIVQLAAEQVEGVADMGNMLGGVDRWLRRSSSHDGVRLTVEDEGVRVDIYLVADATRSLHETCRAVQNEVARTIKEYVGMHVLAVNVHIEDVMFPAPARPETA
jgi:uncharacterized alkaline shock family protein YloU